MDFNGETFIITFIIAAIAALFVALGLSINSDTYLLPGFTYIELMDKTTYLNHYYFITIISLVLVFFTKLLL
jgi:hypothetical protein